MEEEGKIESKNRGMEMNAGGEEQNAAAAQTGRLRWSLGQEIVGH